MINVYELVDTEQKRQIEKWGDQTHRSDLEWFAITSEEFGEAAKELNEFHFRGEREQELITEAIQVMACLKSWLEARDRRQYLLAEYGFDGREVLV